MERLKQLKLNIVGDGLRVRFKPTEEDLEKAYEYGKSFRDAVVKE
jgi:flavorubredoxin